MARKRQGKQFPTKGNLKAGALGQHQVRYSGKEYGDRSEMKAKPRTGFATTVLSSKEMAEKSGPARRLSRGEVARENAKRRAAAKAAAAAKSDASKTPGEKQKPRTGTRVSDARTRVGGGAPSSFVAGGLARSPKGR